MSQPVVVITGASSGIGQATAREFARAGARLVLASRNAANLAEVAAECEQLGATAITVPTDVSDSAQVDRLVAMAIERFGRIDVWVGGAAVFAYGLVQELPEGLFQRVLDVNLMGQVHGARAVLRHLLGNDRGVIILIVSAYAKLGAPYLSAYVASKHGLLGFAKSLRQELRGTGVRDCAVQPATIDTPIYQHAANVTGRAPRPLPPVADPRRVARAIVRNASRPRPTVRVGVLQSLMIPFQAVWRGGYDAFITALMRRIGFTEQPVTPHEGNLFASVPDSNAVSGGWLRSGRQR